VETGNLSFIGPWKTLLLVAGLVQLASINVVSYPYPLALVLEYNMKYPPPATHSATLLPCLQHSHTHTSDKSDPPSTYISVKLVRALIPSFFFVQPVRSVPRPEQKMPSIQVQPGLVSFSMVWFPVSLFVVSILRAVPFVLCSCGVTPGNRRR
jgi:hypothetical protein